MNLAFVFPGQGSQKPGMGRDLYEKYPAAKKVFDNADFRLGFSLSRTIFDGTEEELKKTSITQVAILTVEIAILEILKEKNIVPQVCAGHSLGEYAALIASGAITFESALPVVWKRALFMEEAGLKIQSGMLAVIGLEKKKVEDICRVTSSKGIIDIANFNCPGQIVLSGELKALDEAGKLAKESGAKMCKLLPVSGAFHSRLMDEASLRLSEEIKNLKIKSPRISFIANFTGDYLQDPDEIRQSLIKQVNNPVRWTDVMQRILDKGVDGVLEVGPGKVLSGLWRRFDKNRCQVLTCNSGL
ncbi:[acyl-carrier-protein] S-malonyltransferase [Candidatus Desantisbacteria bacterium CG1_02_38_46]|uniref:Malonyl CoA-acyl carrier protein transacylase n=3 Tax=unclassified Candidatus Desantisiibacteriota TaxID=3106372 RepID=A0A2H9PD48_9BACT|nr:MAG: [acyl-carrier-protein] S-malonyltransferase [Candidatus Desantisbacteria bacterium CG1_02_38_46]PIU52226.1 MAG: [acyl-carrier-protein] S-malonyltransferase [Candidatus Desantisbacteria bacterium CG07_land_8_20_14_0_80_39_15]PIZ17325.1 MAG: [acyl-carrier-protein] S-malonyltransferase [Candidatus Desantisbacteria bacterium CG_4_10_14_0_8_um_filter_39_17]